MRTRTAKTLQKHTWKTGMVSEVGPSTSKYTDALKNYLVGDLSRNIHLLNI